MREPLVSKIMLLFMSVILLFATACSKDAEVNETVTSNSEKAVDAASAGPEEEQAEEANPGFPETDIYLARMLFRTGSVSIGEPENITGRKGYDNQPFFMPDNDTILFSSRHELEQTDLFSYRISTKKIQQLTDTPESEYSPTLTPERKTVSTVRVEMDGTQRLWEFPIAPPLGGITADNEVFSVVFPEVLGVGYNGWLDQDNAYVFIVDPSGEEHKLSKASRVEAGSKEITRKIGRSIRKIPESNNMSYIAKDSPEAWHILELNALNQESRVLTKTVEDSEDLIWLDAKNLIMASGNQIYHKNLESEKDWTAFSKSSLSAVKGDITRLAVSPNGEWLAFVVTHSQ